MIRTLGRLSAILVGLSLALALGALYPYWTDLEALRSAVWQRREFAWALLIVPLVLIASTFGEDWFRPQVQLGTTAPLSRGPRGVRAYLRDVPGILRAAALVFLIGAMCKPITVKRDERSEDKGIDIVLVMDLSGSMRAILDGSVSDLPGSPSTVGKSDRLTRLETAKIVVRDFISRRKSDRIGVVVFAKDAFILSPPTLDYPLLSKLVSKLTLRVIDDSGTAIGDALTTAVSRLRRSQARSKVIILLTDGDNNAGEVAPDYAATLAKDNACKVYTVQVGTGDEVDVEDGKDWLGNPVYSRQRFPVNPELLQRIAEQTGGQAFIATDGKALVSSMHDILNQLEKTTFEAPRSSFTDLFPSLLIPGVLLLTLELLVRLVFLRRFP